MAFWSRKKEKTSESGKAEGKSFKDFIDAAVLEMEGLMAQDPRWYYTLPYTGAMSLEEAKNFEIEKRALYMGHLRCPAHPASRLKMGNSGGCQGLSGMPEDGRPYFFAGRI